MRRTSAILLAAALLVLTAFTLIRFGYQQIQPPGFIPNDYVNFHRASERLAAGEPIYRAADPSPYKYSPTFLLIFSNTFHRLPQPAAWFLWCALSILSFAAATWALWSASEVFKQRPLPVAALLAAFTMCGWHGYLEHFSYGQGDCMLLAAFIAAALISKRRPALAALLLSLSLIMKPQAGLLLAFFVARSEWRTLAFTAGFSVAWLAAPALFWGPGRQLELFGQWRTVLAQQSVEFMTGNLNQSVAATIARLTGLRGLVGPLTLGSILAAGAATFAAWRWNRGRTGATRGGPALWICATILLYLVASPLAWRWLTFAWLPVGVVVGAAALRDPRWQRNRIVWIPLVLFVLNGTILQSAVANALGIAEVDDLSRFGLYCLGSCLLFSASVPLILRERS